ncbi:unnamed protein product [Phytophthora fragariaefolia]|uniref:Unnamed protein product n=1 Tax=Phytophthora fragariaefolia TaxID=1490495 RepID=A0A9W6XYU7_9STRA|nr:unnamed protein product [Phytophthora fragariaefolia]
MRTRGANLRRFPPNFYTPVRRSRGRSPAIVQRLRELRSEGQPRSHSPRRTPPPHVADPSATSRSCPPPRAPCLPAVVPTVHGPMSRPKSDADLYMVHPLPYIQGKSTKLLLSTSTEVGANAGESVNTNDTLSLSVKH